jgi:hypothetical protein
MDRPDGIRAEPVSNDGGDYHVWFPEFPDPVPVTAAAIDDRLAVEAGSSAAEAVPGDERDRRADVAIQIAIDLRDAGP